MGKQASALPTAEEWLKMYIDYLTPSGLGTEKWLSSTVPAEVLAKVLSGRRQRLQSSEGWTEAAELTSKKVRSRAVYRGLATGLPLRAAGMSAPPQSRRPGER